MNGFNNRISTMDVSLRAEDPPFPFFSFLLPFLLPFVVYPPVSPSIVSSPPPSLRPVPTTPRLATYSFTPCSASCALIFLLPATSPRRPHYTAGTRIRTGCWTAFHVPLNRRLSWTPSTYGCTREIATALNQRLLSARPALLCSKHCALILRSITRPTYVHGQSPF